MFKIIIFSWKKEKLIKFFRLIFLEVYLMLRGTYGVFFRGVLETKEFFVLRGFFRGFFGLQFFEWSLVEKFFLQLVLNLLFFYFLGKRNFFQKEGVLNGCSVYFEVNFFYFKKDQSNCRVFVELGLVKLEGWCFLREMDIFFIC